MTNTLEKTAYWQRLSAENLAQRRQYGEALTAQRQLVTFMKGRDGKIRLAGDKLVFSDKRDEAMANKLQAHVDQFAAEVDAAFESYTSEHNSGALR